MVTTSGIKTIVWAYGTLSLKPIYHNKYSAKRGVERLLKNHQLMKRPAKACREASVTADDEMRWLEIGAQAYFGGGAWDPRAKKVDMRAVSVGDRKSTSVLSGGLRRCVVILDSGSHWKRCNWCWHSCNNVNKDRNMEKYWLWCSWKNAELTVVAHWKEDTRWQSKGTQWWRYWDSGSGVDGC